MDSRTAYTCLIAAVAMERLLELRVSRRNEFLLRAQGAVEHGAGHYPWMVALHTAFLASCLLEVGVRRPPLVLPLAVAAMGALVATMAVRWWVIATLGSRWCTRVMVLPGQPLVASGPYRYARHPNYVAVAVELLALPLVHTALVTAIVFSALNGWMLSTRIRVEHRALNEATRAVP